MPIFVLAPEKFSRPKSPIFARFPNTHTDVFPRPQFQCRIPPDPNSNTKFRVRILRAKIARPEKRAGGKKPREGSSGKQTGTWAVISRQNAHPVNLRDGDFRIPGQRVFFLPPIGSGNDPPAVLFLPPALYISQIFSPDPDFFARPGNLFFGLPRKRLRALDSNFGAPPNARADVLARHQISRSPQRTIICPQRHCRAIILGGWNITETAKRGLALWP